LIVLFYPERHRVSNRLLSVFLILIAHILIATRITEAVNSDYIFLIYGIRFFASIALLLYMKSLYENIQWQKQWWHLIIILLDYLVIFNRISSAPFLFEGTSLEIFTIAWYLLISVLYLLLIIQAYREYKKKVYRNFSSLHGVGLRFVYQIIIVLLIMFVIDLLYAMVYFSYSSPTSAYHRVAKTIVYTFFMYFIAIKGKLNPLIYQLRRIELPTYKQDENPTTAESSSEKAEESPQLQLVANTVRDLMENEKFFKGENVTINVTIKDMADKMDEKPYIVSQAINACIGKNFFDLINGYRVDEAKLLTQDEKLNHLSLVGIAFEARFNLKTAFNTAFKKHTGLTLSKFKRESNDER